MDKPYGYVVILSAKYDGPNHGKIFVDRSRIMRLAEAKIQKARWEESYNGGTSKRKWIVDILPLYAGDIVDG